MRTKQKKSLARDRDRRNLRLREQFYGTQEVRDEVHDPCGRDPGARPVGRASSRTGGSVDQRPGVLAARRTPGLRAACRGGTAGRRLSATRPLLLSAAAEALLEALETLAQ